MSRVWLSGLVPLVGFQKMPIESDGTVTFSASARIAAGVDAEADPAHWTEGQPVSVDEINVTIGYLPPGGAEDKTVRMSVPLFVARALAEGLEDAVAAAEALQREEVSS